MTKILFSFCLLLALSLQAQQHQYSWKIGLHGGLSVYYGDLNEERWGFPEYFKEPIKDLNFITYGLSIEKHFTRTFALRLAGFKSQFKANDRRDKNSPYFNRALNIQTDIIDGSLLGVFYLDNGKILGERAVVSPYALVGASFMYFSPKADLLDDQKNRYYYWSDNTIRDAAPNTPNASIVERDYSYETDVASLQTEGKKYSRFTWAAMLGLGLKIRLSKRFHLHAEALIRYTGTDYLDDVSRDYPQAYDNNFQAYASNPSNRTATHRGNSPKNTDWLGQGLLSLHYSFGQKTHAIRPAIIYTPNLGVRTETGVSSENNTRENSSSQDKVATPSKKVVPIRITKVDTQRVVKVTKITTTTVIETTIDSSTSNYQDSTNSMLPDQSQVFPQQNVNGEPTTSDSLFYSQASSKEEEAYIDSLFKAQYERDHAYTPSWLFSHQDSLNTTNNPVQHNAVLGSTVESDSSTNVVVNPLDSARNIVTNTTSDSSTQNNVVNEITHLDSTTNVAVNPLNSTRNVVINTTSDSSTQNNVVNEITHLDSTTNVAVNPLDSARNIVINTTSDSSTQNNVVNEITHLDSTTNVAVNADDSVNVVTLIAPMGTRIVQPDFERKLKAQHQLEQEQLKAALAQNTTNQPNKDSAAQKNLVLPKQSAPNQEQAKQTISTTSVPNQVLKEQLARQQKELYNLERQQFKNNFKSNTQIQALQKQIAQQQAEINALRQQQGNRNSSNSNNNTDLQKQIAQQQAEINALRQQQGNRYSSNSNNNTDLQKQIAQQQAEINALRQQQGNSNSSNSNNNTDLQKQIAQQQAEINALRQQQGNSNSSNANNNTDLQKQIAQQQAEINALRQQQGNRNSSNSNNNTDLQKQIAQQQAEINALRQQQGNSNSSNSNNNTDLQKQIALQQAEINALRQQQSDRNSSNSNNNTDLQKQIAQQQAEINALRQQLQTINTKAAAPNIEQSQALEQLTEREKALRLRLEQLENERVNSTPKPSTDTVRIVEQVPNPKAAQQQQLIDNLRQELEQIKTERATISGTLQEFLNREKPSYITKIYFDVARSSLTLQAQENLSSLVAYLKDYPDVNFWIKGYASPTGSKATNDRLSRERAASVYNYLRKQGIPIERLQQTAHGERSGSAREELDRRAEIHLFFSK